MCLIILFLIFGIFQDVFLMINKLRFDEVFRFVMQLVFGKIFICCNFEVVLQFFKSENFDCIILEGIFRY